MSGSSNMKKAPHCSETSFSTGQLSSGSINIYGNGDNTGQTKSYYFNKKL